MAFIRVAVRHWYPVGGVGSAFGLDSVSSRILLLGFEALTWGSPTYYGR
jgi:hypothetical protein